MSEGRAALRHGVLGVTLAVACFAALDSSTKLLTALLPLAMVVFFRYLVLVVATLAHELPRQGRALWQTRHLGLQLWRAACQLACVVFANLSLRHMPVGEYTAVLMLTPLVITGAAAAALGERVSVWRWLCVLGGFAGALVVIRPDGSDLNWALLYPLGLVASNAAYQVLTSRLVRDERTGTLQFYTGVVGLLAMSLVLPLAWQRWPTPHEGLLLAMVGGFSMIGHHFLIRAYAHAPASRLTPFLYLQIGFAMLMGWLIFGQAPDAASWLGVAMIASCGVAGTWLAGRERLAGAG